MHPKSTGSPRSSLASKKFWIVSLSIAAHVGVFTVAFVTNAWRVDRLDVEKQSISLAVLPPPPAPSGGPLPGVKPKDPVAPVKKIATEPIQLVELPKDPVTPKATADDGGGGEGDKKGKGDNPDGDPDDTGSCKGPACGPKQDAPKPEPQKPVEAVVQQVENISPGAMKSIRIKGDTAIAPPDVVKTQMMRDDHRRSVGSFKICISETGAVTQVSVVGSTKYPAYDQKLMAAMRAWEYRPYLVPVPQGGMRAVPVCSAVSFVFTME